MTPLLAVAIAAITYGSRLAAMVALPRPSGRVEATLARVPAAIFASLATLSLITPERTVVEAPVLLAALGAVLVAPRRSFALCLVAGLAGYVVGEVLRNLG
jgi:branched-subunit amino acid transport protein